MSFSGGLWRIVNEATGNKEDTVVTKFLNASENLKKLKEIKEASIKSRQSETFWPAWSQQIDKFLEKQIDQLSQASSFAEVLSILDIKPEEVPSALEKTVGIMGAVSQEANTEIYCLRLAREAIAAAKHGFYDISSEAQERARPRNN